MPRRYPYEFRGKVLDLIEAGRPVVAIAGQFGVSDQTTYNWRKRDRIDHGLGRRRHDGRVWGTDGGPQTHPRTRNAILRSHDVGVREVARRLGRDRRHRHHRRHAQLEQALPGTIITPRFARDDRHFAVRAGDEEVAG